MDLVLIQANLYRLSEQLKKPGMFRNYLGTLRHLIIS